MRCVNAQCERHGQEASHNSLRYLVFSGMQLFPLMQCSGKTAFLVLSGFRTREETAKELQRFCLLIKTARTAYLELLLRVLGKWLGATFSETSNFGVKRGADWVSASARV
jgi:hypothetical protein